MKCQKIAIYATGTATRDRLTDNSPKQTDRQSTIISRQIKSNTNTDWLLGGRVGRRGLGNGERVPLLWIATFNITFWSWQFLCHVYATGCVQLTIVDAAERHCDGLWNSIFMQQVLHFMLIKIAETILSFRQVACGQLRKMHQMHDN